MVSGQHDRVSHVFWEDPGIFKVSISPDQAFLIWFGDQLLEDVLQIYVELTPLQKL